MSLGFSFWLHNGDDRRRLKDVRRIERVGRSWPIIDAFSIRRLHRAIVPSTNGPVQRQVKV